MSTLKVPATLEFNFNNYFLLSYFIVLYYKKYKSNKTSFRADIELYINTRGSWENSKLCENTRPSGIVFPQNCLIIVFI